MTGPQALRAGVIAAGAGERLAAAGSLKPLVRVGGRPLIDRVLGSIADAGATDVVVIINERSLPVRDHVSSDCWPFDIRWIVQTTPSSMHSFLLVLEALVSPVNGADDRVLISTVDTVVREGAFAEFVSAARAGDADVTLAVTTLVDDEHPLRVRLNGDRRVTAIGAAADGSPLVTAGYYFVRARVLDEADLARRQGVCALRAFLGRLIERGYRIDGVVMPDSIDVDRPSDVVVAERLLQ
jgi:NDP-sugar pyrophosphorylase family protein